MNKQTNIKTRRLPVRLLQNLRGAILLLLALGAITPGHTQTIGLVPYNQVWKYEQSNIDLGTAWREVGFDDSGPGWGTGTGPLGFPANEGLFSSGLTIQTVLNRTTNGVQPRTYYFRTTFVFTNDPTGVSIVASNLIDDAAVFFLNGVEIGRAGFNPGTVVTYTTEGNRAASDINTYGYDVFTNTSPGLIQGTNTYAVEVHQTGGNSSDLAFGTRLVALIPQAVAITSQPTNQTVSENRVVNLTVSVTGYPPPTFQWYKDSSAILDATNQTFTITNSAVSDTGDYFVIASNALNAVTSSVARLTVVADTNGPVLLSVRTDDTFRRITLTWDELMSVDPAGEESNYYILDPEGNQVSVSLATLSGNIVVLDLDPAVRLLPGTNYSIEVDYQQDLVGNTTRPVGTPVNDPNGIVTNFNTFVVTPGFTRFQAFLNRTDTIATFVTSPAYPNGASFEFYTNVVNWPQTVPSIENYFMRFSGLFVAPEDGLYKFNPSHDDDMRLRVHSSADSSSTFTELAAGCCTDLIAGPTLDVTLVGGQSYFYELLVKEIGGGDYAGISVILPSGVTNSPIRQQYLAVAYDPAQIPNVNIASQPQSQSIEENHSATFSVTVTNGGGSVSYQWQVDAGSGFTNIAGATAASYTTPLQPIANSGHQYRVLVSVPGRTITSNPATLTVGPDPTAPQVTAVRGTRDFNSIRVIFNEAMSSASTTEGSNYTLTDSGGNPVTTGIPVLSADLMSVTIPTGTQTPGANYTLRVENVTDIAGNAVATTNVTFPTWVYSRGFALQEFYFNIGGVTIAELRASPKYPSSPDMVRYSTLAELNTFDEFDNYGARISAQFIPPTSGNHTFYHASDDNGELWLSTDANPANITLVAREPIWANRREWTGPGGGGGRAVPSPSGAAMANIATNIAMVAGQSYYFEALMKEGGGGDNLGVTVQLPGGPVPVNGVTPGIPGAYMAALSDPAGATIAFTQQPASMTATQGQAGSFTVGVLGTNVNGRAPVFYQWQRLIGGVFTDIAGANNSNYLTAPLTSGDSGAQYRALVFIPGSSATSSVATVTVGGAAPSLRYSYSGGALTLSWDAPNRLQCTTSLTPPVNWQDVNLGGATTYTVYPSNEFNVNPDALQEVPSGGGRTGSGSGTLTLSNNVLLVNVTYSGLSGTRNGSHFHAAAGRGTNATVAYDLQAIDTGNGASSGAIRGSIPLVSGTQGKNIPTQIEDIRRGLWYLNIHTSTFGGGEIRGQVDPGTRFYRVCSPNP